jgi:hypothetical protein
LRGAPVVRRRPGSKHHLIVDRRGLPLAPPMLTPAKRSDSPTLPEMLDRIRGVRGRRRPRARCPARRRRDRSPAGLIELNTHGAPLVDGLLGDLAAGADAVAAPPRLDHLGRVFRDAAELRAAVGEFIDRYNAGWLLEKNGYRSPVEMRAFNQERLAA